MLTRLWRPSFFAERSPEFEDRSIERMNELAEGIVTRPSVQLEFPGLPSVAERFGFSRNQTGGHMSRSMMLPEFSILTQVLPLSAQREDYRNAILSDNVLGKRT